uniref:Uncharacterized protein n=1 Tax=Candidatus Kentrum eta TaxID=2126337 RepID=A0A450UT42_9GAMM|nr:MAG: hypothetical protein BECKH772A_GA0070896_1008911 [Candidatus Kentron sp. H]VFJ96426.1 MAG: hypothetical protein BECKH772B_GA0070898_1009111 [Candidatus Kentron sp. H]VFK02354.1 MAG: hypothetical protein BECKH772C_GA0070978_1008811 [Candidatus Kentron sp. H]
MPALMSIVPMDYQVIFPAFTLLARITATVFLLMAPITRHADVADLLQT